MAQRVPPAAALAIAARFLNLEDWDPLPGMIKRQCPSCRYLFAAPTASRTVSHRDRQG